ncbi:MAG TPA: chemotaxis protein CheW [Anaeromyxobacteraceae bacterium]|nr:chemotaxis protein CheW [Anaeromyxobacteraceae bacterium]
MELVAFEAAGYACALDVRHVLEVLASAHVTRVPGAPAALRGVLNLRGAVLPVLDLGIRLGGEPVAGGERPLVIVEVASAGHCAILTESVLGLRVVEDSSLLPPPANVLRSAARLVEKIAPLEAGRDLLLLNVETLFDLEEIRRAVGRAPARRPAAAVARPAAAARTNVDGASAVAKAFAASTPASAGLPSAPEPPAGRARGPLAPLPPSPAPSPAIPPQAVSSAAMAAAGGPSAAIPSGAVAAEATPGAWRAAHPEDRRTRVAARPEETAPFARRPPAVEAGRLRVPPAGQSSPRLAQAAPAQSGGLAAWSEEPLPGADPLRRPDPRAGRAPLVDPVQRAPGAPPPWSEREAALPASPSGGRGAEPIDPGSAAHGRTSRWRWMALAAAVAVLAAGLVCVAVREPERQAGARGPDRPTSPQRGEEPAAPPVPTRPTIAAAAPPPAAEPAPASTPPPPASPEAPAPQPAPVAAATPPATPQPLPPAPPSPEQPPGTIVTVQPGDTLWGLARRHRGNPFQWPVLHRANRTTVVDPDLIEPGQRLLVPGRAGDLRSAPAPERR